MNEEVEAITEEEQRNSLLKLLKNGIWVIEFIKVDGSPSTMELTLDPKVVPDIIAENSGEAGSVRTIRAYAVDRGGWRSFVVNNLTKIYRKTDNL
jgi:hypothetical protein